MGNPYEDKLPTDWNCEAERKKFKEHLVQLNECWERGEKIHDDNLEEYIKIANTVYWLLYKMMIISRQYQLYIKNVKQEEVKQEAK